jgi:hypothetical protein
MSGRTSVVNLIFDFRDREPSVGRFVPGRLRSHFETRMIQLQSSNGLQYNQTITVLGAQTVRRGDARPVSVLLGGWDSPAALRKCLWPISLL